MKQLEFGFTLLLLFIAGVVCFFSFRLEIGSIQKPGPGFLPLVAAVVMGILAIWHLILIARRNNGWMPAFTNKDAFRRVIYTVFICTFLGVFFETLGFIISMGIFLVFLLKVIGKERWITIIIISVLSIGISLFIFQYLLLVDLPKGIVDF